MKIDYDLIAYMQDEETVAEIKENEYTVLENCEYLESLGFEDVDILLLHLPIRFLLPTSDFKAFMDK